MEIIHDEHFRYVPDLCKPKWGVNLLAKLELVGVKACCLKQKMTSSLITRDEVKKPVSL